jgi:hypothetical protein
MGEGESRQVKALRVLVACERSGVVRRAFRALGHIAWSNDLVPADDGSPHHLVMDALVAARLPVGWDLMIAHPPCTYLSASGLHWNARGVFVDGVPRAMMTERALEFVRALLACDIPHIALENPVGCISTRIAPPTQYIQPYDFGEDASKRTGLWLKGLPPLVPTLHVPPRIVNGKPRWANQTDSGQNRLPPSETRSDERSVTYAGIARAMARQWSDHILTARR